MGEAELVMQCARANNKQKKANFCQIMEKYGTTPPRQVQGQLKLRLEYLVKHMADASIPNTRLCAKAKISSNVCLIQGI